MKLFKLSFLLFFISTIGFAQNKEALKEINTQIWEPFTTSFETLDYKLFASIHDTTLLRVSGDQKTIRLFNNYIDGYKSRWENSKRKETISFRFFERIVNKDYASERGIYKVTIDVATENERSFYGQFHVLHKRNEGSWKIILDYDSSEKQTINEASYLKAFAIDDFDRY